MFGIAMAGLVVVFLAAVGANGGSIAVYQENCDALRETSTEKYQIGKLCFVMTSDGVENRRVLETGFLLEEEDVLIEDGGDEENVVNGNFRKRNRGNDIPWGLDRMDQAELPLDGQFITDYEGEGVTIYCMDSGVKIDHEEFENRASWGVSFYEDHDGHGHGTGVASVVIGKSLGISRKANLVSVKVLNNRNFGYYSDWIRGLEWIANDATKTSVIQASIYGPRRDYLNLAYQEMAQMGHIVVVCAGNLNEDACDFSPASGGQGLGVLDGFITVGSISKNDEQSSYSNHGPCVNVYAPGDDIPTASIASNTATTIMTGTSFATPHVSGLVATYLEKHQHNKQAALSDMFQGTTIVGDQSRSDDGILLLFQTSSSSRTPRPTPSPRPTHSPTLFPTMLRTTTYPTTSFPTSSPSTYYPTTSFPTPSN